MSSIKSKRQKRCNRCHNIPEEVEPLPPVAASPATSGRPPEGVVIDANDGGSPSPAIRHEIGSSPLPELTRTTTPVVSHGEVTASRLDRQQSDSSADRASVNARLSTNLPEEPSVERGRRSELSKNWRKPFAEEVTDEEDHFISIPRGNRADSIESAELKEAAARSLLDTGGNYQDEQNSIAYDLNVAAATVALAMSRRMEETAEEFQRRHAAFLRSEGRLRDM
ncbi:hypothetical protein FB451DRAFT_1176776 [Mycena latifolia]|nr:hypothetical protein FB451DRAFT_1176776 [Mycena latifolia]